MSDQNMTEYACGNCREISRLGPSARFCPYCGSTSLLLRIKEEAPATLEVVELKEIYEEKKPRRRKQASE